MAQYGMGDDATINEVIEDVDTDKVIFSFPFQPLYYHVVVLLKVIKPGDPTQELNLGLNRLILKGVVLSFLF